MSSLDGLSIGDSKRSTNNKKFDHLKIEPYDLSRVISWISKEVTSEFEPFLGDAMQYVDDVDCWDALLDYLIQDLIIISVASS